MKKTVNSHGIEFGYEMLSALPYAFHLHQEGALEKTISVKDTKELYYFSPNHEERDIQRSWDNMPAALKDQIPNIIIHLAELDWYKFKAPPYKEVFKNDRFTYDKPILVISNKYNVEWSDKPYNFFNIPTLRRLFRLLKNDYQIIYNHPTKEMGYDYHAESLDIGEFEMIQHEFPEVLTIQQLLKQNTDLTYNRLQLRIYANCEKFISLQGGSSIFFSFFGGQNIIYAVKGQELECGSYWKWYHKISGSQITVVSNYTQLLSTANRLYLNSNYINHIKRLSSPVVNVLVRTSNRPKFFEQCYKSIRNQYYKNINLIVSYDDEATEKYVSTYDIDCLVQCERSDGKSLIEQEFIPGYVSKPFPPNLYFNEMMKHTKPGFIIYLDDDDKFTCKEAVSSIVEHIDNENQMLFWKIQFPNYTVPNDEHFGKAPVCCQISTAGFAFHTNYIKYAWWDKYNLGDYRTAISLYNRIPEKVYINKTLTEVQETTGGLGKQNDLKATANNDI